MSYLTTKDQAAVVQDGMKFPCRLASTGPINIAATITTVDTIPLANENRVLLKDQTDPIENGIYEWSSGSLQLTRARDAFTYTDGTQVTVGEGATNFDTVWVQTTSAPITVGVTALNFNAVGSGVITVHSGLTGLGADDHPQYQLVSEKGVATGYAALDASAEITDATHGSRGSGTLHTEATTGVAGFLSASDKAKINATGVLTVSTTPIDISVQTADVGDSAESARANHKHNIVVASVTTITDSTNSEGTNTSLSRSDHGHAHGNRGGGALHAAATSGVSGFLSNTDKIRLDSDLPKSKSDATVNPTVNEDSGDGYGIGSRWVNVTTGRVFFCVDTTVGAAIWVEVNAAHASLHISGGTDEIDGDQLDIDWNPTNYTPTSAPAEVTSIDHLTAHLAGIDSAFTGKASTAHNATHISAGGDEVDGDQLDIDWNPAYYTPVISPAEVTSFDHLTAHLAGIDASLSSLNTSKASNAHAPTHITGGSDQIDGDQLDIDWNPTNYTPATTPTEVTSVDHLTAHLYGIDQEFATKVDGPASATNTGIAVYNGTTGKLVQSSVVTVNPTSGVLAKAWLQSESSPRSAQFSTLAVTPQTFANGYEAITITNGEVNTYMVLVSLDYGSDNALGDVIFTVITDASDSVGTGGTTRWDGYLPVSRTAVLATTWWSRWTGMWLINAAEWTAGTRYIVCQYRSNNASYRAYIQNVRIVAVPLNEG